MNAQPHSTTSTSARTLSSSEGATSTIGTVITVLKADFPDISISKIRFLESEGLISCQRARSGYRLFSDDDIEQIRLILRAQRDAYLPLRVIRARLDDGTLADALAPEPEAVPATPLRAPASIDITEPGSDDIGATEPRPDSNTNPEDEVELPGDARPVSAAELLRMADIDADTLVLVQQARLVRPDEVGRFPATAVPICRAASVLLAHGIDERHWVPFRGRVSRDAGDVEKAISHLTSPEERAATVRALVSALAQLHHSMLVTAVSES